MRRRHRRRSTCRPFSSTPLTDITFRTQTTTAGILRARFHHQPAAGAPRGDRDSPFGKYVSPDYRNDQNVIPPTKTNTGAPAPLSENEITFDLYLPSGTPPPGGGRWPSSAHGATGHKDNATPVADRSDACRTGDRDYRD